MGVNAGAVVIAGANLIDGTGSDPIANAAVVVEDGRIRAAGPAAAVTRPNGARVIPADGRTLLPGFIDAHVHSAYRARDMKQHLLNPPTYNILRSLSILRATLDCGITTARDCGGADTGFRMAIDEALVAGPRLLVSIAMISQTGGHGDTWVPASFRVPKRSWLPDAVADGTDEVRRVSRHLLMAGADFLKICATGGITSVTDSYEEPQYTVAELSACVEEAAARHKPVAAHAEGREGIRNALAAGVYSIEHGWFLDEECLEIMLGRRTWWVPTLALVPRSVARRRADRAWSDQQVGAEDLQEEDIHRRQLEQVPLWRHAVERGARIAMGTDQSHRLLVGENLAELEYMVEFLGMSPMEAIVAGTKRGAECLGRPELGSVEPGKVADLVLVDGDPSGDIRLLQDPARIHVVMKGGVTHKDLIH